MKPDNEKTEDVPVTPSFDATPKPKLDPKIGEAIDQWWGDVCITVGPYINSEASNAFAKLRDRLKEKLATALR